MMTLALAKSLGETSEILARFCLRVGRQHRSRPGRSSQKDVIRVGVVICRGPWDDGFVGQAKELGTFMAAGLEMGII